MALSACQSLPPLADRSMDKHIPSDEPSILAYANAPLIAAHQGLSGVYPLDDGQEAFAARLALIRLAEHSLDLQYYIWRNDTSGQLLFRELVKAARRGVKVRLLLDDNNTVGQDRLLQAINNEPNIQIRLFNPFVNRHWRALGYITDFNRLNRRMHNKSMTADNQVSIVGGRNIGDEYFDMGNGLLFVDLDVLTIGPVVEKISTDFDRYWNSSSAYPFDRIVHQKRPDSKPSDHLIYYSANFNQHRADHYEQNDFVSRLKQGSLEYEWAQTKLISDDPAKALPGKPESAGQQHVNLKETEATNSELALSNLLQTIPTPKKNMLLITPYFVPTKVGVNYLSMIHHQGVRIRVLTNSLAATDVPIVHSGYARYRQTLLQNGIELYELKKPARITTHRDRGFTGNSASSLHAKTFTIDNNQLFVGSLNLDPRSARLNTEMGVLIQSPELVQYMNQAIDEALPYVTYQVLLTPGNKLRWQTREADNHKNIMYHEPEASLWRRGWVKAWSWLPIENLL
ncbi:phospholipase D family protein [Neisseriaceae bacterium ESL0693]|nr:phospholipase D family protein [Neisseriaceae bacterium ESL0693]